MNPPRGLQLTRYDAARVTHPSPCPCRTAEPHDHTFDLERRLKRPSHKMLKEMSRGTIRCLRCGAAFNGGLLPGGGIYGDTEWMRICDDGDAMVAGARVFAIEAHGEQRYGDAPFVEHLDAVVAILRSVRASTWVTLAAGYLHDVIEDTSHNAFSVSHRFGQDVLERVAFCTDEKARSRKQRKAKTNARMRTTLDDNPPFARDAVTVALADRLANVRACVEAGQRRRLGTYRREQEAFRAALTPHGPKRLWRALDTALAP